MNKVVAGRRGDIFDASDYDGASDMGSSRFSGSKQSMNAGDSQAQLNDGSYKYDGSRKQSLGKR